MVYMSIYLHSLPTDPVSSERHQRTADQVHVGVGQNVPPDTDDLAASMVLARVRQNFAVAVHSALASRSKKRVDLPSVTTSEKATHQRPRETGHTGSADELQGLRGRDARLDEEIYDGGDAHDRATERAPDQARNGDAAVRPRRHLLERQDADGRRLGENAQLGRERVAQTCREVEHGSIDERARRAVAEHCSDGVVLMSAVE